MIEVGSHLIMDLARDTLSYCSELVHQGTNWLLVAPLSVRIAGFLVASYGAYWVWFFRGTRRVRSKVSLDGKTVIITGANAGIGRETAVDLASRGARVIMACRNPTKAQAALAEVRQRSGSDNVVFKQVDTSDLKSVRAFADQILKEEDRLDILINNAGIGGDRNSVQSEGFDIVMTTNHVGHFVLTMALIDLLKKSAPSRIISVSSLAHVFISDPAMVDYSNKLAEGISVRYRYARSKLANVHFTKELARRLAGTNVTAYSLHPGTIFTNILKSTLTTVGKKIRYYLFTPLLWLFLLSEKDGAQTTIYCAIDESVTQHSGGYFANCQLAKESKLAKDMALAKQLWDVSCEATGIDPNKLSA
ncbi:retinol dehydrogenase 11-like [Diadema antillarum]|uniref:retinol dehydrogenase 11-like n=1 Tax=Diadema antillarum TaxID=105358 RepID=UPI003A86CF3A